MTKHSLPYIGEKPIVEIVVISLHNDEARLNMSQFLYKHSFSIVLEDSNKFLNVIGNSTDGTIV